MNPPDLFNVAQMNDYCNTLVFGNTTVEETSSLVHEIYSRNSLKTMIFANDNDTLCTKKYPEVISNFLTCIKKGNEIVPTSLIANLNLLKFYTLITKNPSLEEVFFRTRPICLDQVLTFNYNYMDVTLSSHMRRQLSYIFFFATLDKEVQTLIIRNWCPDWMDPKNFKVLVEKNKEILLVDNVKKICSYYRTTTQSIPTQISSPSQLKYTPKYIFRQLNMDRLIPGRKLGHMVCVGQDRASIVSLCRSIVKAVAPNTNKAIVMSRPSKTVDLAATLYKYIPDADIYTGGVQNTYLESVVQQVSKDMANDKLIRTLLVLDNTSTTSGLSSADALQNIYCNGRSLDMTTLSIHKDVGVMPTFMRAQVDYWFMSKPETLKDRQRLYTTLLCKFFPSFEEFNTTFDVLCKDKFDYLVVNKTARSKNIEDIIFSYRNESFPFASESVEIVPVNDKGQVHCVKMDEDVSRFINK